MDHTDVLSQRERHPQMIGSVVPYLPRSRGMFVLQNNLAPTARSGCMNLHQVLQ